MKLEFDMVLGYDQEYISNGTCSECKRMKHRKDIDAFMCVRDGKETLVQSGIKKGYFQCPYIQLEHPVKRDLKKL